MPKERRDRSVSIEKFQSSPYRCSTSHSKRSLIKNPLESDENITEWEDARCPVCIEHPHNAILLLCSSHDKGCRPFMCDTSYRHSNCFDQFRKSFSDTQPEETPITATSLPLTAMAPLLAATSALEPATSAPLTDTTATLTATTATLTATSALLTAIPTPLTATSAPSIVMAPLLGATSATLTATSAPLTGEGSKLVCPLCRGDVTGWVVVEAARGFMNTKPRTCASETCDFTGNYADLRKHARLVHPMARPSEADPERQRDWRRMERQRDLGDLLSTLQSSMAEDRTDDGSSTALSFDDGGWLTVFFLIRVFRPGNGSRSSSWSSGGSRARAQVTVRRRLRTRLWGESYDGEARADGGDSSDDGSGSGPHNLFQLSRRRPAPENDES